MTGMGVLVGNGWRKSSLDSLTVLLFYHFEGTFFMQILGNGNVGQSITLVQVKSFAISIRYSERQTNSKRLRLTDSVIFYM